MIAKTTFSFMGLLIYYISQTLDSLFILQVLGMVFGVVDVLVTTPIVVEGGSAERRTLVTGIALCYSGAGALLFGPVIYFLNEKFPTAESFYYLVSKKLNGLSSNEDTFANAISFSLIEETYFCSETCFYLVCALFGWLYGLCCNLQHKKLQEDRPSKKVKWASRRTDQEQPGNGNQTLEDEYVAIPMADRPPDSNGIEEALQNQVQTEEQPATNDKSNSENMERENGIESIVKKSMLKRFTNYLRGIFLRFKSATFVAISIASFLQAFGLFVPIVHLPAHAISVGISKVEAVFLVSAIGLSSTIGRIFNGWLSDQPKTKIIDNESRLAAIPVDGQTITLTELQSKATPFFLSLQSRLHLFTTSVLSLTFKNEYSMNPAGKGVGQNAEQGVDYCRIWTKKVSSLLITER
ncbi:hypothetical protein GHT06_019321 [Daphnia sinensis]|uniref:Uncharacterized protein n=1 Tax=Daphnia sinensis TaxID=1820382 RepID=A0AAD5KKL3_9CRUS|nr:hypothetical protein GHT06_019321 [Daphnia sinensis]